MTEIKDPNPIVISEKDVRGARDPENVSTGDTLLPMLIGGLVIAVLGGGLLLIIYAV